MIIAAAALRTMCGRYYANRCKNCGYTNYNAEITSAESEVVIVLRKRYCENTNKIWTANHAPPPPGSGSYTGVVRLAGSGGSSRYCTTTTVVAATVVRRSAYCCLILK